MYDLTIKKLIRALIDGDQEASISNAKTLLDSGISRHRIITEGLEEAMSRLDAKCTVEEFNLLEIMLCGRAVTGVMNLLYPQGESRPATKGTVVLGSLEGDIHDLGKNILKVVLMASGFGVADCGKDCPVDLLIESAEKENALAIGISGLITAIIPQVREVREKARNRGLDTIKVIAGGAALKQANAENLNVDFVAQDSFQGLHYLEGIVAEEK